FFSSRRRHTRFSRDWSSDVCSSDLGDNLGDALVNSIKRAAAELISSSLFTLLTGGTFGSSMLGGLLGIGGKGGASIFATGAMPRSEERRVGKECGALWRGLHDVQEM